MSDTPEKDEVTRDDVVVEEITVDTPQAPAAGGSVADESVADEPVAEAPEEPAVDDDALGNEPESGTGDVEPAIPDVPAEVAEEDALEDDDAPVSEEDVSEDDDQVAAEPVAAAPSKPSRRPRSRRGSETAAAKPAPRRDGPKPVVRAQAKYVRSSARKARLVCDHIRGKSVEEARSILAHIPRSVAEDWQKLLESAVANAEHNHELLGDDLKVLAIYADEGPTLKRFRPRAMGRASRIRKRTSHLTIQLTPKD